MASVNLSYSGLKALSLVEVSNVRGGEHKLTIGIAIAGLTYLIGASFWLAKSYNLLNEEITLYRRAHNALYANESIKTIFSSEIDTIKHLLPDEMQASLTNTQAAYREVRKKKDWKPLKLVQEDPYQSIKEHIVKYKNAKHSILDAKKCLAMEKASYDKACEELIAIRGNCVYGNEEPAPNSKLEQAEIWLKHYEGKIAHYAYAELAGLNVRKQRLKESERELEFIKNERALPKYIEEKEHACNELRLEIERNEPNIIENLKKIKRMALDQPEILEEASWALDHYNKLEKKCSSLEIQLKRASHEIKKHSEVILNHEPKMASCIQEFECHKKSILKPLHDKISNQNLKIHKIGWGIVGSIMLSLSACLISENLTKPKKVRGMNKESKIAMQNTVF